MKRHMRHRRLRETRCGISYDQMIEKDLKAFSRGKWHTGWWKKVTCKNCIRTNKDKDDRQLLLYLLVGVDEG